MPQSIHRLSLLLPLAVLGVVACRGSSSDDGPAACVGKASPAGSPVLKLQLSRIDFGEVMPHDVLSTARWRGIGFNLDGLCSSSDTALACRPRGESSPRDGDLGIDNAFARSVVPLLGYDYAKSAAFSGGSYLEINADGSGTLLLVGGKGAFRVPLVRARTDSPDGRRGTLGAIVPVDALLATLGDDLATSFGPELCSAAILTEYLDIVRDKADLTTAGAVVPSSTCDGISLGMMFEGTPVDALPTARPPTCTERDAGAADAPEGG